MSKTTAPAKATPKRGEATRTPAAAKTAAAKPTPVKAPTQAATKATPAQTAAKPAPAKVAPSKAAAAKAAAATTNGAAQAQSPTASFSVRFAPAKPAPRPEVSATPHARFKPNPKLVNAWKTKAGRDLTEEELLSMPESEYMNDKQREFFHARLSGLKDEVLSNAGETTEHLREDTSIVPDPADRATIEEEHALELRTRDRERKLLKKIVQALALVESGEYGYCDETGEAIGLGRLLARPTATLSLEAQQRRELKQKMFGD